MHFLIVFPERSISSLANKTIKESASAAPGKKTSISAVLGMNSQLLAPPYIKNFPL